MTRNSRCFFCNGQSTSWFDVPANQVKLGTWMPAGKGLLPVRSAIEPILIFNVDNPTGTVTPANETADRSKCNTRPSCSNAQSQGINVHDQKTSKQTSQTKSHGACLDTPIFWTKRRPCISSTAEVAERQRGFLDIPCSNQQGSLSSISARYRTVAGQVFPRLLPAFARPMKRPFFIDNMPSPDSREDTESCCMTRKPCS